MIQSVLTTLFNVIVPLSIPVSVGAILLRFKQLEIGPLLTLVLYFLTPCLIFQTLLTAQISFEDVNKTLFFCLLNLLLLWSGATFLGRILKLPAPEVAGLTLISTLTNSVNYGLPLILLAFGKQGLDKASVYVIMQMIIVNTFGVYFAARSSFSISNAIKSVFSLPAIYAAVIAILLRTFNLHLPEGIEKGFSMVAQAYSPIVLTVLGAQMATAKSTNLGQEADMAFRIGMILRMLLAPLVAYFGLYLLDIGGILFAVFLILSSMPVAVNAVVLAEKFNASARVVSRCILWTTLFSFITLPLLIALVKP